MTSLILGRYWSSEAGEGSSPNAVSRQFRKSSGTWASSLAKTKNRRSGRNSDHVSICAKPKQISFSLLLWSLLSLS